jgi:N-carbamoyl-L-amino-acid hydrolase
MNEMADWIHDKLCELNVTNTMDVSDGFTRLGFTKEEREAHDQFKKIADQLGLTTYQDLAGNQWAVWFVDKEAPTIAVGSHLDTVHNGGGYDGVAGVLCALAAIKMLKEKGFKPQKNIAVICFISEESARFGVSTIGSKAVAGDLEKADLAAVTDAEGISIKQAVESMDLKWEEMDQAGLRLNELEQFIELHIEQGKHLQESNAAIGIVERIARPIRLNVLVEGLANHTGTTPMNQRQDALVAIAPLIRFVNEEALKINQRESSKLVATVSTVNVEPNAMTSIPGKVTLGIDIRSVDDDLKKRLADQIKVYCQEVGEREPVSVTVSTLVDNNSVTLDHKIKHQLVDICNELGFKTKVMNSGAGHDVMNMSRKWPSGLIFIPCRDGISHHPDEFTSTAHLLNGTKVIESFLQIES